MAGDLTVLGPAQLGDRDLVLYVTNRVRFFLSHRLPFARAAQKSGFRVMLASSSGSYGEVQQLRSEGIVYVDAKIPRGLRDGVQLGPQSVRRFIGLLRQERPTVVHSIGFLPAVIAYSASQLVDRAFCKVVTVSGLGSVYSGHRLRSYIARPVLSIGYRMLARWADVIICQNESDEDFLVQRGGSGKVKLIRGVGVDLASLRPAQGKAARESGVVVAFVGRLLWSKGVEIFVDIARQLRDTRADFVFVGEPDEDNVDSVELDAVLGWQEEGVVNYWGWHDDMVSVYRRVDIVVLPTTYGEGCPKVLLEAAAMGIPVVATDIAGCRSAVEDGVTGRLVDPGDVEELARAVRTLVENPSERLAMGRRARRLAIENFDSTKVAREVVEVYRTVAG